MDINRQKIVNALRLLEALESAELDEMRRLRKSPVHWVNPFLSRRVDHDLEEHLLKDVLWEDGDEYRNFCRMDISSFESLLSQVKASIEKEDTIFRLAITARVRLALTLRFIATGDSYRSLEFLSRVSRKTISKFVPEVLNAIYDSLHSTHLKMPRSENEWLKIAEEFERVWNFPNTVGAMDGKHFRIKAPENSGSDFFNYKGFHSVVLLAVVDAHTRFQYINVGSNGRTSDNVIYKCSDLYEALVQGQLELPPARQLGSDPMKVPYFLIGDDIFALDKHLMKPYNRNSNLTVLQEIFNYRVCRARMTVEMAFGRMVSRFRIFQRPVEVSLDTVDGIIKVCCVLHNMLTTDITPAVEFCPENSFPDTVIPLNEQIQPNSYRHATTIRDIISRYCIAEGDIHFQWDKIRRARPE
nr:protein ALP1-like [Aedes albopictus]